MSSVAQSPAATADSNNQRKVRGGAYDIKCGQFTLWKGPRFAKKINAVMKGETSIAFPRRRDCVVYVSV